MASKLEQQYIENLKTFTDALGDIVTTLKDQSNKDNIDTLNNFFKTPMDGLKSVVDELKNVTQTGFKNLIQSNNDLISKIGDSLKSGDIDISIPMNNVTEVISKLVDITEIGFKNTIQSNTELVSKILEKINSSSPDISTPMNSVVDVINKLVDVTDNGFSSLNDNNLKINELVNNIDKNTITGFSDIKTSQDEILSKIDSIRQQKESGWFENIENPKNKNKIVDGIKTVALIAGGVLAMGLAFKLVGGVNFVSVIALSGAMYLMAKSFSQITELKNMKLVEIAKISSILPLMALALTASSWILKALPNITFAQGLSLILVGSTMGVAAHLLLKAIKTVDFKEQWRNIVGLPIMLPAIALGLTASAWILKMMPNITFAQGLSLILLGSTLGISAYFLLKAIRKTEFSWKTVLGLPIMLPAIALGLTASAYILKAFPEIGFKQALSILLVGATLGIASWVMLKAFKKLKSDDYPTIMQFPIILPIIAISLTASAWILKAFPIISFGQGLSILLVGGTLGVASWLILKAIKDIDIKKDWGKILLLPVLLPYIAAAITFSSVILQDFQPLPNPLQILIGSLVIGVSMLAFAPIISIIGKLKFKDMLQGVAVIPLLAGAIVLSAYIFKELPDDMIYPDLAWTLGAGLSFLIFTPILYIVGKMSLKDAAMGLVAIPLLAGTIVAAAWIFKLLPSEMISPEIKWTLGVGLSLVAFGGMAIAMGLLLSGPQAIAAAIGLVGILAISATIVGVSHILNKGIYKNYPSYDWAKGVGGSLIAFSLASVAALAGGAASMIGKFFSGGQDPLMTIVKSIVNVANELGAVDWSSAKYPTKDYAQGVGGLLEAFANVFVKISAVQGFNAAIGKLFGGGGSIDFIGFVKNASEAMLYARDTLSGDWTKVGYPTKDYAEGVGGLLESFANVFSTISKIEGKNKFLSKFGGGGSTDFIGFVGTASDAMVSMRDKLAGDWTKVGYPTKDYAEGVGGFLESLANSFASISKVKRGQTQGFSDFVYEAANAMIIAKNELDKVVWINNENYPKKEYSEGIGTFLLTMAEAYSKINSGGLFKFLSGNKQSLLDFVKESSNAIVESSKILANGNYSVIVPKDYVDGFSYLMLEMKNFKKLPEISDILVPYSINISEMISKSSLLLSDGKYENIPNKAYTSNFSNFMSSISKLIEKNTFGDATNFGNFIGVIKNSITNLTSIPDINESLLNNMKKLKSSLELISESVNLFLYEKGRFGRKKKRDMTDFSNFSNGLLNIVTSLKILSTLTPMPDGIVVGYQNFLNEFGKLPELSYLDPKIESINKLANSFATLADSLKIVNDNLEGFTNLSKGLFLISIIDDKKFDNVLHSIDKHKNSLKVINQVPKEQENILATIEGLYKTSSPKTVDSKDSKDIITTNVISDESKQQQQFYADVSDIRTLLYEFRDILDKPNQAGSFHN